MIRKIWTSEPGGPGWGRSPGEGNGNPLQYSCLENPRGGGALWATVHGVTKSQTGFQACAQSTCPELSAQGLVPLHWGCALPSPNAPGKAPNHPAGWQVRETCLGPGTCSLAWLPQDGPVTTVPSSRTRRCQ